jgi:hypothetical protein
MRFEGGKGGGHGVTIHITPQISIFGCANYSSPQKNNSFMQQVQMKLAVDQKLRLMRAWQLLSSSCKTSASLLAASR